MPCFVSDRALGSAVPSSVISSKRVLMRSFTSSSWRIRYTLKYDDIDRPTLESTATTHVNDVAIKTQSCVYGGTQTTDTPDMALSQKKEYPLLLNCIHKSILTLTIHSSIVLQPVSCWRVHKMIAVIRYGSLWTCKRVCVCGHRTYALDISSTMESSHIWDHILRAASCSCFGVPIGVL